MTKPPKISTSSKQRTGGPTDMGLLIGATLAKSRLGYGVKRARALLLWPKAVGLEIARLTKPRSQQGGTLLVEVRDSTTAHHLTMQRQHFLHSLQQLLGDDSVTELRFVVGTVKPPPTPARAAPLPAVDRARARELVEGLSDPELKQRALRAAEAITRARRWREEQGWRACPVCLEAAPQQPCRACTLTLEEPHVRRAAQKLLRQPEHYPQLLTLLGDSGALAARHLAAQQLLEQLDMLALECVRNGGESEYLNFLQAQSDIYLSLSLRKPRCELRCADRASLPERVRRVLSAGL